MPPFLIEFPADDAERAQRFWQGLLQATLARRDPEQGRGWQVEHEGIVFGLHERGSGPGARFSLPYFPVTELAAAVERERELGGEIVSGRALGDLSRLRRHAVRTRRSALA